MSKSHIAQVGFLMPVISDLMDSGVNVERLLITSGLDRFKLNDPNFYVPVEFMYKFFDQVHRQQGIDELAVQFSESIELATLSQWGELVALAPDLLSAFQFGVKNNGVILSNQQLDLEINGAITTFQQRFTDSSSFGRDQTEHLAFSLLIRSVQLATGGNWAPLEIHFQSSTMPNIESLFPSGWNAKIVLGQPATAIKFPTSLLTKPMSGAGLSSHLSNNFPGTGSLSSRIERLLDSKHDYLHMNAGLITDMTSLSTRTLQRNLAEEGESMSSIIDKWRLKKSLEMLAIPNIYIKEISEFLGYNDVSNFNRAFRRWTNTTPCDYREGLSKDISI
ncbi:AraC family transcriptional regulator [Colwellia piezophila]|uniref:AraC family transcriptional regulator n=1 Tax=Colwellia piezophila TaxID=211668 RepID=UPI00037FE67E|nr:AraC family transcriptional regulator [Colwellia piezophila]